MQPIERFSLERHAGPYADWPVDSELWLDGMRTGMRVPGYVIDAQYDTPLGTLLATSFDCPFEDSNAFVLLDGDHRILARREIGTPYASWLLDTHWPESDTTLVLHYYAATFFRLQLLEPTRWWRRPRLRLRRVLRWRAEPRMVDAHAALLARLDEIGRAAAAGEAQVDPRGPTQA